MTLTPINESDDPYLRPGETVEQYHARLRVAGMKANGFAGPLLMKVNSDYFKAVQGVQATETEKFSVAREAWQKAVDEVKGIFDLALDDVLKTGEITRETKLKALPHMVTQGQMS